MVNPLSIKHGRMDKPCDIDNPQHKRTVGSGVSLVPPTEAHIPAILSMEPLTMGLHLFKVRCDLPVLVLDDSQISSICAERHLVTAIDVRRKFQQTQRTEMPVPSSRFARDFSITPGTGASANGGLFRLSQRRADSTPVYQRLIHVVASVRVQPT